MSLRLQYRDLEVETERFRVLISRLSYIEYGRHILYDIWS